MFRSRPVRPGIDPPEKNYKIQIPKYKQVPNYNVQNYKQHYLDSKKLNA